MKCPLLCGGVKLTSLNDENFLKDHLNNCPNALTKCQFCDEAVSRGGLTNHLNRFCKDYIKCDKCNGQHKRKLTANHKKTCPKEII